MKRKGDGEINTKNRPVKQKQPVVMEYQQSAFASKELLFNCFGLQELQCFV